MRLIVYIVSTLITRAFFSEAAYTFEWHCSSTDAMITLDVLDSFSGVQEGQLHGSILAEHPAVKQTTVAMHCTRQGSDSATLLLCTPAEVGRWPLKAYIFRSSRPEQPHIFARVYLGREILADLMPCQ